MLAKSKLKLLMTTVSSFSARSRLSSSLSKSRELLQQYKGGGVVCYKDAATGIATVTLNHVERKNALSGTMMLDLADIVSDLEAWEEGKGVIVHGAGGTFCSGGDLTLMKAIMCPEEGVLMSAFMQDTLTRLYDLPMLSVALIEGAALGGGAEVAVSCDLRVATADATIGFVQSRMGVSPGWGGGAKLVEQLGRSKALKLLMSAQVLTSQEALRAQLVDEILTQSSHPVDSTKEWMAQYLKAQSLVARVAKGVVVNASQNNRDTVLAGERALFANVWGGAAQKSAIEGRIRHKK